MVLFGICVVDTDSLSYLSCSPAVLCWLQLKLKRNESIVLLIVIVVLPSYLYVFWLMDFLVMRPIVICNIWHVLYLLSGIIVLVRSLIDWLCVHLAFSLVWATNVCT